MKFKVLTTILLFSSIPAMAQPSGKEKSAQKCEVLDSHPGLRGLRIHQEQAKKRAQSFAVEGKNDAAKRALDIAKALQRFMEASKKNIQLRCELEELLRAKESSVERQLNMKRVISGLQEKN